jgi:Putative adhesin
MKRINWRTLAVFVIVATCAAMASSPEDWSKTFAITGRPDLRIETSDADIHVDTWDQKTIEVRVSSRKWGIGQGGLQVTDHQNGDSVEINVRFPHGVHILSVGDRRVVIEVHMPREGKARLHTGDGEVHVNGLKGDMDVETGDGHAAFEGVDGSLRAHTGDGRIHASGRFDVLKLETGDGRIEAEALAGSTIGTGWELRTGDGSVRLSLPETFAADMDLHTSDGHITLDMPVTVQGRYDTNRIEGKMNGGGGPLRIETGDGSIRILRADASH